MSKLYFLNRYYNANTAPSNRTLAYLRGLSELGVETNVVFFLPGKNFDRIEQRFNCIDIEYCWDTPFYCNRPGLRSLFYVFFAIRFFFRLKKGDSVYLYNMADFLHFLIKKKGINVYLEKTEHPTMYKLGSGVYRPSLKTYLNDCQKVKGLITISTSLKSYFSDNGVAQERIHIVNMIVDLKRFENLKKNANIEPYIAYCGTASNNKDGVDDLIKAFAIVHKKHPNVKLYIMGKTPNKNEKFVNKKLIEDLGLDDFVVFTGIISAKDMPQMLVNSIAVALARPNNLQAQNGFPSKLGEYLLSGSPTVVTAVGDIPLFLTDMKDALIAQPNNPEDFAKKLMWVIEHPIEALSISTRGKETALRKFHYLHESKKLKEIILASKKDLR